MRKTPFRIPLWLLVAVPALAGWLHPALAQAPPYIVEQPRSQYVPIGSEVTFTVTAWGDEPLAYQWYKDGQTLPTSERVLRVPVVEAQSAGQYTVRISNPHGSVLSKPAELRVVPLAGWGTSYYGQTTPPPGLTNVAMIATGLDFSVALTTDGRVVAWGNNYRGRTAVPAGLSNVVAIAAGAAHAQAVTEDGRVVAWGESGHGRTAVPVGLTNAVAVAAGDLHSLALTTDGRVVCWGMYDGGANYVPFETPPNLRNVVAIASGASHALALRANGQVVAWGNNNYGQTNVPPGLSDVVAIAGGGDTVWR